jgi:hypothetical protein
MSKASELLEGLTDEQIAMYTANPETEGHIVIGEDRFITVPESLKRIAVQYDHNIETVTFDCPRYWDGIDMSEMTVYINYMDPKGTMGSYIADNVRVSDTDDTIMNFDWTISRNVTQYKGALTFMVCIKDADENGNEKTHWNSELNKTMTISEGMECNVTPLDDYPDIVAQMLAQVDAAIDEKLTEAKESGEFDGESVRHVWTGTVLTIVSASGASSSDLKGDPGPVGPPPTKGVDYWTSEDKQEIGEELLFTTQEIIPDENGVVTPVLGWVNKLTAAQTISFSLPVVDAYAQILIQVDIQAGGETIDWGTTYFFNNEIPTIDVGRYNFIFEYDDGIWYAGAVPKGGVV